MSAPVPVPKPARVVSTEWLVAGAGTAYVLEPPWLLPVAVDPAAMADACEALLREADAMPTPEAAWRSRSLAGYMLVCLRQSARAVGLLQACAAAQQARGDLVGAVGTHLRLTQALQADGRPTDAVRVAEAALAMTAVGTQAARLQHFAQHHLGKALHQAGDTARARDLLAAALATRRTLGEPALAASTEQALALLAAGPG